MTTNESMFNDLWEQMTISPRNKHHATRRLRQACHRACLRAPRYLTPEKCCSGTNKEQAVSGSVKEDEKEKDEHEDVMFKGRREREFYGRGEQFSWFEKY